MNTYLNSTILKDFFIRQPERVPFGSEHENTIWNSFWKFLKEESNIFIDDTTELNNKFQLFLTQLSTGREEAAFFYNSTFFSSHKYKIATKDPYSIYCIDEPDSTKQKLYTSKNGLLVGFLPCYLQKWVNLKLLNKPKILPLKNTSNGSYFSGWHILSDYLMPFSDVVIVDNFILSHNELIPSNFEKILVQLSKSTPVNFNLTILTHEGVNGKMVWNMINEIKTKYNLKCKVDLYLATNKVKRHDRGIFTNYLRIIPGDTFNFFDSNNKLISKGDHISFCPLVDSDQLHAAKEALASVKESIQYLKENFPDNVFGKTNNALLKDL